jgi:hypothetical protein
MYGVTRATTTLIGVAVAGFLLWVGTRILDVGSRELPTDGEYWAWIGTLAAAGLVIALSQLLGGWTKWGWPRVSVPVFLVGFLPALVAGLWVLFFNEPHGDWVARHVRDWSDDIGIGAFVDHLGVAQAAIGFGLGLVFGLTFDTSGPRMRRTQVAQQRPAPPAPAGPPVAGAGYAEQTPTRDQPSSERSPVRDDAEPGTSAPPAETPPRDQ